MNARKRSKDSGRSGLTRNKLFGALGHVHNPFSMNSHKDHDAEDYKQDENIGNLRAMSFEVQLTKLEASMMAQRLIAQFQKS
jgi:hypothetical protein